MKKCVTICVLLLVGTTVFAKPVDVQLGRTYIVKSTDGSGQVPLYEIGAKSKAALYVPDGTEFRASDTYMNDIQVSYQNKTYLIERANFAEEAGGGANDWINDLEKRAKKRRTVNTLMTLLSFAVLAVLFIRNKKRPVKSYTHYYTTKRSEFPWLDNWIKENGDPTKARVGEISLISNILSCVLFFVIGFGFSIFVRGKGGIPSQLITLAIAYVLAELVAWRLCRKPGSLEPERGLTLECPSCGCPHSWGMNSCNITLDSKVTTTTKERVQSFFSTRPDGSVTLKTVDVVYKGTSVKDFQCQNCGHTEHNEYEESWHNSEPESGMKKFNPPKKAWGVPK